MCTMFEIFFLLNSPTWFMYSILDARSKFIVARDYFLLPNNAMIDKCDPYAT